MRIKTQILLITIFLTALTATVTNGQATTLEKPQTDSAVDSQTTRPVQSGDDTTQQRLLKALDALDKADALIKAQAEEGKRKDDVIQELIGISKMKDEIIAGQAKENDRLARKSQAGISFLFGLVKIKF